MIKNNNDNYFVLEDILEISKNAKVEEIAPNFRKKNLLTQEQISKIVQTISTNLEISPERALIAMYLLFLQGAASAGAPITMSVDLHNGKCVEKRNIINACKMVTEHQYIRRIAETLALEIGEFACNNRLAGELAYRINNRVKAETGTNLTEREMAFCSSFSQAIPNLAEVSSERLAKLLAEDYQKRFEGKKKNNNPNPQQNVPKQSKKKKNK